MDWLSHDGRFLGIEWNVWKVIGWVGNVAFFSRFIVQWYASEKQRRVVVPISFWWLSLTGSLLLLIYALAYRQDSVFTFAYAFTWIPYIRNLILQHRDDVSHLVCETCSKESLADARYCSQCGTQLKRPSPPPKPLS